MKYQLISQDTSHPPSITNSEEKGTPEPPRRYSATVVALISLSTTTLVSVLILLALSISQTGNHCDSQRPTATVPTRYGRNYSFMSIDHRYDYIWKDMMQEGFGVTYIAKESPNEEERFGEISM